PAVDGDLLVGHAEPQFPAHVHDPPVVPPFPVEAELAAIELVAGGEVVEHQRLIPDVAHRRVCPAPQHLYGFDDLHALAEVEIAEAGQAVEPPAAAIAQVTPNVGLGAPQLARRLDGQAAAGNAGGGRDFRIFPAFIDVKERPGDDRQLVRVH